MLHDIFNQINLPYLALFGEYSHFTQQQGKQQHKQDTSAFVVIYVGALMDPTTGNILKSHCVHERKNRGKQNHKSLESLPSLLLGNVQTTWGFRSHMRRNLSVSMSGYFSLLSHGTDPTVSSNVKFCNNYKHIINTNTE